MALLAASVRAPWCVVPRGRPLRTVSGAAPSARWIPPSPATHRHDLTHPPHGRPARRRPRPGLRVAAGGAVAHDAPVRPAGARRRVLRRAPHPRQPGRPHRRLPVVGSVQWRRGAAGHRHQRPAARRPGELRDARPADLGRRQSADHGPVRAVGAGDPRRQRDLPVVRHRSVVPDRAGGQQGVADGPARSRGAGDEQHGAHRSRHLPHGVDGDSGRAAALRGAV